MTNCKIETGKLTAKLRDAVPVCLMENDKELKQYKNIDLPEEIKVLPSIGYDFNVPMDGKITFKIYYAPDVLPKVFPEPRAKMTRAEKAALKVKAEAETAKSPEIAKDAAPAPKAPEVKEEKPSAPTPEAPKETKPAPAQKETKATPVSMNDTKAAPAPEGPNETKAASKAPAIVKDTKATPKAAEPKKPEAGNKTSAPAPTSKK